MSKILNVLKLTIMLLVCCPFAACAPRPDSLPSSFVAEVEDLETGAAAIAEKNLDTDLEGSSSYGHGYYSPYFGGHHGGFGGSYPYYGGYGGYGGYGLSGYYGLGYPYYGGYYGYHGLHGHYY